jgi:hypothetical protein
MDKKEIIIKAVELVTFLFAAFGQFLLKIAPPDSRSFSFVTGISSLLLLAILLLLSSVTKKRKSKNVKRNWIIGSLLLLIIGAVIGFIYKSKLDNNTVVFQTQSKEYAYVIGNTLTRDASVYKDSLSLSNKELINHFGGPEKINEVWSEKSIQEAHFQLNLLYTLFVLFLCSSIFSIIEGVA